MSKAYSGRIHDPNHVRNEYDIYFNDELIEGGGIGILRAIKSSNVTRLSDYALEITFESPIPADYIILSTYNATIITNETVYGTIAGGYNSVDNTAYRFGANNYNLTVASLNTPEFNADRTKVTLTSPTYKFNTANTYSFIAVSVN
jgi:hypothetical protein